MTKPQQAAALPRFHGRRWVTGKLPSKLEAWQLSGSRNVAGRHRKKRDMLKAISKAGAAGPWVPPKKTVFFIADPHADADAFNASLIASGGVRASGGARPTLTLTKEGRKGVFVIGGDCLDKGPSNLELLRAVRTLMDTGADVRLLAGNHDVRLLMGILAMGHKKDPGTEHLFVRMGPKVVPLLREIFDHYLAGKHPLRQIPDLKECRKRLFPSSDWFEQFPRRANKALPAKAIDRELTRMRRKVDTFEESCLASGLSLRHVYATALKCRALFLERGGEFSWFFDEMQLAYRAGSYLFIHAGLDDRITRELGRHGVGHLNRLFRRQIKHDLFSFYYGPVANAMRTKYRKVDLPLTHKGVRRAHARGVQIVVHGHRNRTHGQRLALHSEMIHVEGDITMDRNSRKKEDLGGYGAGVTIVSPAGRLVGISTDYPKAKVFEPSAFLT